MASKKSWVYSPGKPRSSKPKISESLKRQVQEKFDQLIDTEFKPKYIKAPPEDPRFNYLVDIFSQWHRSSFYICGKYHCPGPNAISPSFDSKFSRFEYAGGDRFNISYMRHTGKWWPIRESVPLDECLEEAKSNVFLLPQ